MTENQVVDGEMYRCVKIMCFVRDTVYGDGGAHLATTASIWDA